MLQDRIDAVMPAPRRTGSRSFRGLFALALAFGMPSAASAQPRGANLAVLPIKLLDTSAEPTDQSAEHAQRLRNMGADLTSDLAPVGPYRTVALSVDDIRAHCPQETTACLLAAARARGADLVFVGVVHKSSTLIMQMWARIVDAREGAVMFSRELNFRGDTDEAWRRAEAFLIDQVRTVPPQLPR